MTDTRDKILEFLQIHTTDKEGTDIELVKNGSRLENRISEVKTDLKDAVVEFEIDLQKSIKEFKTDLQNNIQDLRDDIKDRISGLKWFIGTTVAIAAVIVSLIIKHL